MIPRWRTTVVAACALGVTMAGSAPLAAQEAPPPRTQVLSANPFGLLLEFFNAEYERVVTEASTVGIGGSMFSDENDTSGDDDQYVNADVFWRYYPNAIPFEGWAFGVKLGATHIDDGTFFGYGFDVNHSWVLGRNENFYVGVGFGLKRLLGTSGEEFELSYVPTIRIVNVGIAF